MRPLSNLRRQAGCFYRLVVPPRKTVPSLRRNQLHWSAHCKSKWCIQVQAKSRNFAETPVLIEYIDFLRSCLFSPDFGEGWCAQALVEFLHQLESRWHCVSMTYLVSLDRLQVWSWKFQYLSAQNINHCQWQFRLHFCLISSEVIVHVLLIWQGVYSLTENRVHSLLSSVLRLLGPDQWGLPRLSVWTVVLAPWTVLFYLVFAFCSIFASHCQSILIRSAYASHSTV